MTMLRWPLLILTLGSLALSQANPSCEQWAESGECDNNPDYMDAHCAKSCSRVAEIQADQQARIAGLDFFDLSAEDIDGNEVDFSQFRNQVTIITNVASQCGYTESHYKGLVNLYAEMEGRDVNILAFPCNQFGKQEPGSAQEIKDFAASKGVKFTMMEKVNVNGANTHLVYIWLKNKAGPHAIQWNFNTYYAVGREGQVGAYHGIEPLELKETIFTALGNEEL